MNLPIFLANRLSGKDKENLSGPVIRISIATIALGIAVMMIALSVLIGFQTEIRSKVIGFAAHIRIDNFDDNASYEAEPVSLKQPFYPDLGSADGFRHIQVFALKAGIIKTDDQIQGIVFKGISKDFDWDFFKKNMVSGEVFQVSGNEPSDQIILSSEIASRLKLRVGDDARMYFLSASETQPRGRKFIISGIYETGLEEFDQSFILGDLRHIQKLNNWSEDMVSGFEVFIHDFKRLDDLGNIVYQTIGYDLNAETVKQTYPQIFDWLRLMDINVIIIIVLMLIVSGITMISTLLIMILERTNMIGVLKALGMKNYDLRRMFIMLTTRVIGKGMLYGNLVGFGLLLLQYYTHLVPLDKSSYYVDHVPVSINFFHLFLINAGAFAVCMAMVLIPVVIISRIAPVKAIIYR